MQRHIRLLQQLRQTVVDIVQYIEEAQIDTLVEFCWHQETAKIAMASD